MKPSKPKKKRPEKTGGYWRAAYLLLNPRLDRFTKSFQDMEGDLRRSGTQLSFRAYLAGMLLATLIAVATFGIFGLIIVLIVPTTIVAAILIPFGFALMGGSGVLALLYLRPKLRAGTRRRRIDDELAYVTGQMAVLAAAGLTPEKIVQSISEEDSKEVVIAEFRKMVRDMNLLGMDFTQALQEARRRSPSMAFSAFLDGMVSTSKSGADIKGYLIKSAKEMMADKRIKTKQFAETVGVIAEMYTIMLVVMPLILIILFSVMGVIAGNLGGISIAFLIQLVVYVMVPFGGVIVMIMADGIMPKR